MSCLTALPANPDGVAAANAAASGSGLAIAAAAGLMVCALTGVGCRTASVPRPDLDAAALAGAVEVLDRPLPADMAALYRLRVPASGGLRLAVLQHGQAGRMTVSEPFGSAVSVTSWSAGGRSVFFDLREGCRLEAEGVASVLGVTAMPMPQAVRLLGGRLPAAGDDRVVARDDGRLEVMGAGWSALLTVAPEPWRVLEVRELTATGEGWRLRLDEHSGSVPGHVRVDGRDRGWAELDLVRLEWGSDAPLPPEPELPPCQ